MNITDRAKLIEAVRLLREIIGEATQLPLIQDTETANMSNFRKNTIAFSREVYNRHLHEWINHMDPWFLQCMARHRMMNISQYFMSMESRGIIEVRREGSGHSSRYLGFRFILKIPAQ
jgi:phage portal protein BeeE